MQIIGVDLHTRQQTVAMLNVETGDGASHPGTEDCRDHFDDLEERSVFRRQRVTSASSLSVSGRELVPSS